MGMFAADATAILVVSQPWVLLSTDQRSAEVYMNLRSTEGAVLVGVTTFAAALTSMQPPGKRTKPIAEIALPANIEVQLAPVGHRITLMQLTKTLKLGDHVPISLRLKSADGSMQELLVNAEVRLHSALEDELHPHKH